MTEQQVEEIREKYREGYMVITLAREYGVANSTISRIVHFQRYRPPSPIEKYLDEQGRILWEV